MAGWQPTAEGLQQLLGLFKATQGANNEQHRHIFEQLRSFNSVPDYNCYLVFILNQLRQEDQNVRQTAGLVLKNNVKEHWETTAPDVKTCAAAGPHAGARREQHPPPHARPAGRVRQPTARPLATRRGTARGGPTS